MAKATRRYWLFKSDPDDFGWDELWSAPGRRTGWDGVRNYQARNFMRDEMRKGDGILFYHSRADPPAVVGLAEIVAEARTDPTQFDPANTHHDPASTEADPRWVEVEIRARKRMPRAVSLSALKAERRLAKMLVVQRGQRLSVQPVTPAEWAKVLELGGLEP